MTPWEEMNKNFQRKVVVFYGLRDTGEADIEASSEGLGDESPPTFMTHGNSMTERQAEIFKAYIDSDFSLAKAAKKCGCTSSRIFGAIHRSMDLWGSRARYLSPEYDQLCREYLVLWKRWNDGRG